jgi:CheY-like chemotaxis protein
LQTAAAFFERYTRTAIGPCERFTIDRQYGERVFLRPVVRAPEVPFMTALDHTATPSIVLVVEDEMLLRMRVVDMVEDAGYTPVEAVDADEAFAILQSRSDIALLFTDIQMPGSMNGLQLAHAVHALWPPIKIILASGQLSLSRHDIPQDSRFFGKPLTPGEMIAEMRDMLGHA